MSGVYKELSGKKRKYPVSSRSVREKALLMLEVREWADWLKQIGNGNSNSHLLKPWYVEKHL